MSTKTNLLMEQGATFSVAFPLVDANSAPIDDLTGWTAAAQMRKSWTSSGYYVLTTELASSQVVVSLTAAQTANVVPARYLYDVRVTDASNNAFRVAEGVVTVTPAITRS